jgi:hypothetical protein
MTTYNEKHTEVAELEKVETPNVKTAQELADFLNRPVDEIVTRIKNIMNSPSILKIIDLTISSTGRFKKSANS